MLINKVPQESSMRAYLRLVRLHMDKLRVASITYVSLLWAHDQPEEIIQSFESSGCHNQTTTTLYNCILHSGKLHQKPI